MFVSLENVPLVVTRVALLVSRAGLPPSLTAKQRIPRISCGTETGNIQTKENHSHHIPGLSRDISTRKCSLFMKQEIGERRDLHHLFLM